MSKLAEYLSHTSLSQASLAERLGITRGHMSSLIKGARQPSLDLAVRIERETDGKVPACSWVADPHSDGAEASETCQSQKGVA